MRQWRAAAIALERVRVEELATADLTRIAADLEDACVSSLGHDKSTSGLVVQQALLQKRGY